MILNIFLLDIFVRMQICASHILIVLVIFICTKMCTSCPLNNFCYMQKYIHLNTIYRASNQVVQIYVHLEEYFYNNKCILCSQTKIYITLYLFFLCFMCIWLIEEILKYVHASAV